MRANQLRLWFASMAYVLLCALRRIGLANTQFARASCGTIRLKLLKIGALVRTSVRRIKLAMPSAFPYQTEYRAISRRTDCRDRLTNQIALLTSPPRAPPQDALAQRDSQKLKILRFSHNHGFLNPLAPAPPSNHPRCEKCGLARISQRGRCIGAPDLRKSCCENGLSRRWGNPDADRV